MTNQGADQGRAEVEITEVAFQHSTEAGEQSKVTITGVPSGLINAPDKILQLMDLLELPEGTNATVTVSTAVVIVR